MWSKKFYRLLVTGVLSSVFFVLALVVYSQKSYSYPPTQKYVEGDSVQRRKIDWTDHDYIRQEEMRSGAGEYGRPVYVKDAYAQIEAEKSITEFSYNGIASDMVSLDRSVPDTRHGNCKTRKYYVDLPSVSVIIVFHNEYLSFLLRTLHSVFNRTPSKLLAEVILVDDNSSKEFLGVPLEEHVASGNFSGKVKILRLETRHGLMRARMAGILQAQADIIVVMDAHIEVNTNWLPPLIEPIADDPTIATEPIVNYIHWNTLEYDRYVDVGGRGGFTWSLDFDFLSRQIGFLTDPADNYENPVFLGAIMAINKQYFWRLGGYDDKLEIWGGEQYDISFKIWMCGGRILRIPCSQAGHNYKQGGHHPYLNFSKPYIYHNYNRIAEVWLDGFKEIYYKETGRHNISAGDVSHQRHIRNQCRPFAWYLENVFPEILYNGRNLTTRLWAEFFGLLSILFFFLFLKLLWDLLPRRRKVKYTVLNSVLTKKSSIL